jgi:5-methylcytosine-specific restriction endonuclease McrA
MIFNYEMARIKDIKVELTKIKNANIVFGNISTMRKKDLIEKSWETNPQIGNIAKYLQCAVMRSMLCLKYNSYSADYLLIGYPNNFYANVVGSIGKLQKIYSSYIPKCNKDIVWKIHEPINSDRGYCTVCGSAINKSNFECGHNIARANGGSCRVDNLLPICRICNAKMGTIRMDEFKKNIKSPDSMLIDIPFMMENAGAYPIFIDWKN